MPNHVSNVITFTGSKESIAFLKSKIITVSEGNPVVDFGILVPEPDYENEKLNVNTGLWVEGVPGWYMWRCEYWGTKWNAYDSSILEECETKFKVFFNTAWSTPEKWLINVASVCVALDIKMDGMFADEDCGGDNWGRITNKGCEPCDESMKPEIYLECAGIDITSELPE